MQTVSDRFLQALKAPHKYVTTCTITPPGGVPTTVDVEAGTLQVDASSRVRRRVNGFRIVGDSTTYELVATPGAIFHIRHGLDYGEAEDELVDAFYGEAQTSAQTFADGTIGLTLVDLGNWLSRCRFLTPYAPAVGTTRVAAITAVVTNAIPGVTVLNLSSDTGTLVAARVWTDGPLGVIADLTKDGNTDGYFRPDGVFVIVDKPTTDTPYVWSASSGAGGVLIAAERSRPTDRLYNTVVVRPSAADGSQTWTQQTAAITDTSHPRHSSKIGVVPYFYASPSASSADVALSIANTILDRVLGTIETLSITSIANPALEANDSLRVITPRLNNEPAKIFQHFIDSFSLSLTSGDMTMATRSQVVTDA
jgi:hypothetical protein